METLERAEGEWAASAGAAGGGAAIAHGTTAVAVALGGAIVIRERTMSRMGARVGQALLKIVALVGLSSFLLSFWQTGNLQGLRLRWTTFHQYLAHFGLFLFAVALLGVFARRQ
jgi:hypothetical protein